MHSTKETLLHRVSAAALCLVFAALCTACPQSTTNPIAPGADGKVSLGAGVQPSDGVSLELRFYPSNCALPDTFFPGDCESFEGYEGVSLYVSAAQFPYTFSLGPEGVGATSQQQWYVIAWLAGTMGASTPEPGEYYGIAPVLLNDCTDRCNVVCYCGRIHNVEVLVDSIAP